MKNLNYEDAFEKLEKIIEDLDSDKLTLEESLQKYEEGLELYKYCEEFLNGIEGKVKMLTQESSDKGEYMEIDFLESKINDEGK